MGITLSIPNDLYQSKEYRNIIRSCKDILLSRSLEQITPIDSLQYANRNHFYKYLRVLLPEMNETLIWTTAYINDIIDPTSNWYPLTKIQVVEEGTVNALIRSLKTRHEK